MKLICCLSLISICLILGNGKKFQRKNLTGLKIYSEAQCKPFGCKFTDEDLKELPCSTDSKFCKIKISNKNFCWGKDSNQQYKTCILSLKHLIMMIKIRF
jgi:hypothetical protein